VTPSFVADAIVCGGVYAAKRSSRRTPKLTGAERGAEGHVRLEAAVDLDGSVAGADQAFAGAPGSELREVLAEEVVSGVNERVVGADDAEAAFRSVQFGREFVELGENGEVFPGEAAVFGVDGSEDACGDRLRGDAGQYRAPVVDGELGQSGGRDQEEHGGEHSFFPSHAVWGWEECWPIAPRYHGRRTSGSTAGKLRV